MRKALPFLLVLWLSGVTGSAQIVETPIPGDPVAIDSGLVSGKVMPSGVKVYLGVPFAAPPVRELRWRDPQPVAPWKGVYHADRKPSMCMQQMRAHDLNHYFGEESASEDCLYLNLWAPAAAKAGDKRPVLVFIYGGAFVQGTANMANYSGEHLAKKGVVYVAMNYRVGAFGFMAHPELSAENGRKTSGNWGLLDQIAALQWVHRNIERFGGDPGNVTIMGQSAGSASVSYLQSSPLARGLIHRVFGMSGSAIVNGGAGRTSPLRDAEQAGRQFQEALKAASLADLRQLPADVIYAAQRAQGAPRFQPVVDTYLLPAMPNQIFADGRQNDVPVLLGFMHDESTNPLRTSKTVTDYTAAARRLFGDAADAFLKLYPVASDADVAVKGADAAREAGIESTQRAWARAQAKTGRAAVYINVFSRVHPYAPGVTFSDHDPKTVGAYHTGEVPYWFQTQDAYNLFRTTRNWTPYDRDLSATLSDALIAFAKTGNPNTPAIVWPRYDPANEQMMEFGDSIRVLRMNTAGLDFFVAHPAAALPAGRDR
jgi:para-nitrobenzyl esterase